MKLLRRRKRHVVTGEPWEQYKRRVEAEAVAKHQRILDGVEPRPEGSTCLLCGLDFYLHPPARQLVADPSMCPRPADGQGTSE